jgi:hypothetical protein
MRICQLINLCFALFLISCSSQKVDETRDQRLITPGWLKIPPRFSLRDKDDNYLTHPFFDVTPGFNKDKRTINFFVTTPEESPHKFNFDMYSGRLYGEHEYCGSDDIWDAYTGELQKPNFTQGIVPRTYDQNGNPQRIIVFGMPKGLDKNKFHPQYFEIGKIVGSLILEACDSYPCDLKSKWKPTQILLAVNPNENKFSKINLLNDLRNKTDWTYFKAMIMNQDGVHQVGKTYYPAFRISKELSLDDSLQYFEKKSSIVKVDELAKWREGCFKLYDDVWEKTEKIRSEKRDQQDHFLKFYKEFYAKNSELFYSCSKLVRPGTINDDPKRLWFFTYLQAFTNLEKNSFFYSCSDKSWSYNPKVDETHYFNNQNKELERCRARDLEKSFDQAINGLSLMKSQTNKEFRFIEYDSGQGGSHQKIYAWIAEEGKTHICKNKKDRTKENTFDVFPQDVTWQGFTPDEDKIVK